MTQWQGSRRKQGDILSRVPQFWILFDRHYNGSLLLSSTVQYPEKVISGLQTTTFRKLLLWLLKGLTSKLMSSNSQRRGEGRRLHRSKELCGTCCDALSWIDINYITVKCVSPSRHLIQNISHIAMIVQLLPFYLDGWPGLTAEEAGGTSIRWVIKIGN